MYSAQVFFVVQQYNGDASGQLRGDVSVYTTQEAATPSTSTSVMSMPGQSLELCRISVQTKSVTGEDPLVTINNALAAKFSTGTYTLVA